MFTGYFGKMKSYPKNLGLKKVNQIHQLQDMTNKELKETRDFMIKMEIERKIYTI